MLSLIAFGVFVTVLLVFHGCYLLFHAFSKQTRARERFKARIQSWTQERRHSPTLIIRKDILSEIPWLNRWLKENLDLGLLRTLHGQTGTHVPLGAYLLSSAVFGLAGVALGTTLRMPALLTFLWATAFGALPFFVLYRLRAMRLLKFQRQMPDALDLIARALRAGHAFFVGLKIVGDELADPISTEFQRTFEEITIGLSIPEALQNLAGRMDCPDVKYFATAVSVQRETGGNLAEIMAGLGHTIRKRFEFHEKVKALSAEGLLSAIILFILPIAIAVIGYLTNPTYMSVLFIDPVGRHMIAAGALLMVIGGFVTKSMIRIDV